MFSNLNGKFIVMQLKNGPIIRGFYNDVQPADDTVVSIISDLKETRVACDEVIAIEIYTKEAIEKLENSAKARSSIVTPGK